MNWDSLYEQILRDLRCTDSWIRGGFIAPDRLGERLGQLGQRRSQPGVEHSLAHWPVPDRLPGRRLFGCRYCVRVGHKCVAQQVTASAETPTSLAAWPQRPLAENKCTHTGTITSPTTPAVTETADTADGRG